MVAPELFHRTIPRLCAQTWRACAIPERTAAAHARLGLQQGVRRLSTALSPIPGDIVASPRPGLIHRKAPASQLIRKHPGFCRPRPAWHAATSPPTIHSFIPSLCAQALDIAGFLSDSRKPAAALACSGHPPACPQLHPQLPGISTGRRHWLKIVQQATAPVIRGANGLIPTPPTEPSPLFVHKPLKLRLF